MVNADFLMSLISTENKVVTDDTITYGRAIRIEYNGDNISYITTYNSQFLDVDTTEDISCNII